MTSHAKASAIIQEVEKALIDSGISKVSSKKHFRSTAENCVSNKVRPVEGWTHDLLIARREGETEGGKEGGIKAQEECYEKLVEEKIIDQNDISRDKAFQMVEKHFDETIRVEVLNEESPDWLFLFATAEAKVLKKVVPQKIDQATGIIAVREKTRFYVSRWDTLYYVLLLGLVDHSGDLVFGTKPAKCVNYKSLRELARLLNEREPLLNINYDIVACLNKNKTRRSISWADAEIYTTINQTVTTDNHDSRENAPASNPLARPGSHYRAQSETAFGALLSVGEMRPESIFKLGQIQAEHTHLSEAVKRERLMSDRQHETAQELKDLWKEKASDKEKEIERLKAQLAKKDAMATKTPSDPKLDRLIAGQAQLHSAVTGLGHHVRSAVKAPPGSAIVGSGSPEATAAPMKDSVFGTLVHRLIALITADPPLHPRSKQAASLMDLLRSMSINTEDYEERFPDDTPALEIAAALLQNTESKAYQALASFLPDIVSLSVDATDKNTINVVRNALRKSDMPVADLMAEVGLAKAGNRGDVIFVTAMDDNAVEEEDDFDDDGFEPSKLLSSGHYWQTYGSAAFGLTKEFIISFAFRDGKKAHLLISSYHASHALEFSSFVVEHLLSNGDIGLLEGLTSIEFQGQQGQSGGPPELQLTPKAIDVLRMAPVPLIEFQYLRITKDQEDCFSFGCYPKLFFHNSVLESGGTSLLPFADGDTIDVEFLGKFPKLDFIEQGIKYARFKALTLRCTGFSAEAAAAAQREAARLGERCSTVAADFVRFSDPDDCSKLMNLFQEMGEKGLSLSVGKYDSDCDFNICSFHGHGLLPHRTDAEEISRAMFDKFAMEYYKGKHKDAGKAVSLFFCFEFAHWLVWPV